MPIEKTLPSPSPPLLGGGEGAGRATASQSQQEGFLRDSLTHLCMSERVKGGKEREGWPLSQLPASFTEWSSACFTFFLFSPLASFASLPKGPNEVTPLASFASQHFALKNNILFFSSFATEPFVRRCSEAQQGAPWQRQPAGSFTPLQAPSPPTRPPLPF